MPSAFKDDDLPAREWGVEGESGRQRWEASPPHPPVFAPPVNRVENWTFRSDVGLHATPGRAPGAWGAAGAPDVSSPLPLGLTHWLRDPG